MISVCLKAHEESQLGFTLPGCHILEPLATAGIMSRSRQAYTKLPKAVQQVFRKAHRISEFDFEGASSCLLAPQLARQHVGFLR